MSFAQTAESVRGHFASLGAVAARCSLRVSITSFAQNFFGPHEGIRSSPLVTKNFSRILSPSGASRS